MSRDLRINQRGRGGPRGGRGAPPGGGPFSNSGSAVATAATAELDPVAGPGRETAWPGQVELILSALETGLHRAGGPAGSIAAPDEERRLARRTPYRVRAWLRLFSDGRDAPPRPLFTRDVGARGLGFITPQRLPLGYGGLVELAAPDGRAASVHCTLVRCRQAAPGWFEGCLAFNREQPDLVPEGDRGA